MLGKYSKFIVAFLGAIVSFLTQVGWDHTQVAQFIIAFVTAIGVYAVRNAGSAKNE